MKTLKKKDQNVTTKQDVGVFPSQESAAQYKLCICTHHLKQKRKQKYYFKCAVSGCHKSFNTVKDWNVHHLCKHKSVTYVCSKCPKCLRTPSSIKDHKLTHKDKPQTCGRCGKTFLHVCKLNLHVTSIDANACIPVLQPNAHAHTSGLRTYCVI